MIITFLVVKHFELGGGIEKYTREVAPRLAKRGHTVTIYSMPHYGRRLRELDGVQIRTVPCLPFSFAEKLSASGMAALRVALSRTRPAVSHLHSVAAGAFAGLLKARGIPCVLQMHGIEWQRGRWGGGGKSVLRALEKASLRHASAFTAVSQTQCEFYARTEGVQMEWIPTGADIRPLVEPREILDLGLKPGGYVLFASRLVREKGAHHLISAFRNLHTDTQLVIAGDAKGEEAYKSELRTLAGGDPRIRFLGFVRGRLLEELFSHARIYAQPSELEGLSIALLEGMSYGRVCLASDIPENLEALGDTGVTFRSGNVADLQAKLSELLASPSGASDLGERARERVRQHFSWDRITDQLESLYLRTAGPGSIYAP